MQTSETPRSGKSLISFALAALIAMTAATAQVATGTTGIDTSGSYTQEVQACMAGRTQQDQATCLKEARNAQADKNRDAAPATATTLDANATARCDALAGEDKADCRTRAMGYGNTSGSVSGGGVLRQLETVVPAK